MRPLMLLLFALPLLIGALVLVNAPTSVRQLLPHREQWALRGTSAHVTMDVFSHGRVASGTGRP
jgi:hypothetical protein